MKINIYIIIATCVFLLGACNLERESYNEIYPENFFRNEADVNKALTSLYSPFRLGYGTFYGVDQYSYMVASDFTSGMLGSRWTAAAGYPTYQEHRWVENESSTGNYTYTFANNMYSQYNKLTTIKNTIKNIEQSNVSDSVKIKSIAEAKCLYAWIGFIMYDLFGPVPLVTDEAIANPDKQIYIPRLSDEEYTKIMLNNLDDAIAGLPIRQDDNWGRASKGLALMLKLKFYLIDKKYVEAEKIARELYSYRGSVYDLQPTYQSVFDYAHIKNKEIIHALPCGLADGYQNRWLLQFMPPRYSSTFQCWFTFCMRWPFYDTFEQGDARLNTIITTYTSTTNEFNDRTHGNFLTYGAAVRKIGEDPTFNGQYGSTDLMIYRFADVMLSLAECINENNNGPTQEAVGLLNEIRKRVGLSQYSLSDFTDKAAFRKVLLNERLHEFYCEGLSRQDKIRFGTFVSDSKASFPNSQSADYKVRFAIPSKYILESNGVVKQNLGY